MSALHATTYDSKTTPRSQSSQKNRLMNRSVRSQPGNPLREERGAGRDSRRTGGAKERAPTPLTHLRTASGAAGGPRGPAAASFIREVYSGSLQRPRKVDHGQQWGTGQMSIAPS